MEKNDVHLQQSGKQYAAVCGLYCQACSWFIATAEDPERLKKQAARLNWSAEEGSCHGCRSGKRLPYCDQCRMFACAADRGIDVCCECEEYPCEFLKKFQSALPHRIELWGSLERIMAVGYEQWLKEMKNNYSCPRCATINSAYDLKCRKCGEEPSCRYVARHRRAIEQYLEK